MIFKKILNLERLKEQIIVNKATIFIIAFSLSTFSGFAITSKLKLSL